MNIFCMFYASILLSLTTSHSDPPSVDTVARLSRLPKIPESTIDKVSGSGSLTVVAGAIDSFVAGIPESCTSE